MTSITTVSVSDRPPLSVAVTCTVDLRLGLIIERLAVLQLQQIGIAVRGNHLEPVVRHGEGVRVAHIRIERRRAQQPEPQPSFFIELPIPV
jgi:hypothetical protein